MLSQRRRDHHPLRLSALHQRNRTTHNNHLVLAVSVSDYPSDVWANRENENIAFGDKACCRSSDSFAEPDPTCASSDGDDPLIALIVSVTAGCIVALAVLIGGVLYCRRKKVKREMSGFAQANGGEREQEIQSVSTDRSNNNSRRGRLASDRSLLSEQAQPTDPPQELPKADAREIDLDNKDQCRNRIAPAGNGHGDAVTVVAIEASQVRAEDVDECVTEIRL